MENCNACGPVKVNSGDFEPPGASAKPLIDDRPPTVVTEDDDSESAQNTDGSPDDPQP